MISKPLLKQSIKANGLSWLLVTILTSLMLGILIIVLGRIPTSEIRDSLTDTFIKSELETQFKSGAIDGYIETYSSATMFYPQAKNIYDLTTSTIDTYVFIKNQGNPFAKETTIEIIVNQVKEEEKAQVRLLVEQILTAYTSQSINDENLHDFKCNLVIDIMIANVGEEMSETDRNAVRTISKDILDMYAENKNLTNENLQNISRLFVENVFYQGLINDDSPSKKEMLEKLGFKSMIELLNYYGFSEVKVSAIISSGMTQYISLVNNNMTKEEAKEEVAKSLLSQMPKDVGKSLQELGELNINNLIIGTIFYKISGLLLPIVYTIITANNLIVNQVDSGSLAYVLSTPTKRNKVTFTQMIYLIGSLVVMYFIMGIVGIVSAFIAGDTFTITISDLLLLNVGALVTMIAISGICFLASTWFNRSKYAMGVGGGLSMFFLVATILGLFGSSSIPEALKIETMNIFNYVTIISLFNANAILEGGKYLYGFYILLIIGLVTYTIGILRFNKKDLPL